MLGTLTNNCENSTTKDKSCEENRPKKDQWKLQRGDLFVG